MNVNVDGRDPGSGCFTGRSTPYWTAAAGAPAPHAPAAAAAGADAAVAGAVSPPMMFPAGALAAVTPLLLPAMSTAHQHQMKQQFQIETFQKWIDSDPSVHLNWIYIQYDRCSLLTCRGCDAFYDAGVAPAMSSCGCGFGCVSCFCCGCVADFDFCSDAVYAAETVTTIPTR